MSSKTTNRKLNESAGCSLNRIIKKKMGKLVISEKHEPPKKEKR
jgi:hypothetical protein